MPHELPEALLKIIKVGSAALGWTAIYFALFLYENEEGVWQNRLDTLWISIHDRARASESLTTSVIRRFAQLLTMLSNRVFGERLLSVQTFCSSINLSIACSVSVLLLPAPTTLHRLWFSSMVVSNLLSVYLTARHPRLWNYLISASLLILFVWRAAHVGVAPGFAIGVKVTLFSVAFSTVGDFLALTAIRKWLVSIASNSSRVVMAERFVYLVFLVFFMEGLPIGVLLAETGHLKYPWLSDIALWSALLNASTALYLVVPILLLCLLSLNQLVWPALGRIVYSLARFKILSMRRTLITVGSVLILYAFGLNTEKVDTILKLLF
jgi:hypothetical protein